MRTPNNLEGFRTVRLDAVQGWATRSPIVQPGLSPAPGASVDGAAPNGT